MTVASLRVWQDEVILETEETRVRLGQAHCGGYDGSSPNEHFLTKKLNKLVNLNASLEALIRCLS